MIIILIRTLILYIIVLIGIRFMGKSELSEMQPFEIVVILMIAELASLPMEDTRIPLINGIVAIITILFVQVVISCINLKSEKARKIICGTPSILINKGIIDEKQLKRLRININDLIEQLRTKDYPLVSDIEFAILETNGDLSVIPKPEKRPVTMETIKTQVPYEGLPVTLILDGKVNHENLKKINQDANWLNKELKKHGIKDSNEVLIAYIDETKEIYIQKKDNN